MRIALSKNTITTSALIFIVLLSNVALAQTKVVVIPLSGDDLKPLQNIITVAKANGDFDSPIEAIASITDASAANPYLLVIAPGVYELPSQLVMKEYVEISGSGKHATILRGSFSAASSVFSQSGLVVGANHASLSALRIENLNGLNNVSVGIFCDGITSLDLSNLAIFLEGGVDQIGLHASSSSVSLTNSTVAIAGGSDSGAGVSLSGASGSLSHVTIDVQGGTFQQGVSVVNSSSANVSESTITLSNSANPQIGIFSGTSSSVDINNSSITVSSNVTTVNGVLINEASSATITGSRVTATGSFAPIGISVNTTDSFARIRSSDVSGAVRSLVADTGSGASETFVSDSTLEGQVDGNPVCSFVHTSAGVLRDPNCSEPMVL